VRRAQFGELMAFVEVARQRSFTRAAATLGLSPPTLSQSLRSLEEKLGVRLLNRTTRSVSLTDAGEQLLLQIDPLLEGIDGALDALTQFRGTPRGRLRLVVARTAAILIVSPIVPEFLAAYPDIELEVIVEDTQADLVANRIDAGIQVGERIEKDMIATRLIDPFEMVAVAAPAYLAQHPGPIAPADLRTHSCIRQRSSWDGAIHPWMLQRGDERLEVAVNGPFIVNDLRVMAGSVLGGVGIGLIPDSLAKPFLDAGRLVRVLDGWAARMSGVYLYYPSRHQIPATLRALIDFMRTHTIQLPQWRIVI
jgi:DNA-binding transcriptional LysR family regulator